MNAPFPAPSILEASGVDTARAVELLGEALGGADDGEMFVERSESEAFVFDDGRLKSAAFDATEGFGLRVVAGETAGYAHASEISEAAIAARGGLRGAGQARLRRRRGRRAARHQRQALWRGRSRSPRPASPTRSPCCRRSTPSPARAIRAWCR